jgi:hypothetical protein
MSIKQTVFKTIIIGIAFSFITGCGLQTKPDLEPTSQLEKRQLQTRNFSGVEEIIVMKATIAALQDEGYNINTINDNIGIITAERKHNISTKNTMTDSATATLGTFNKIIRLRINITKTEEFNGLVSVMNPRKKQSYPVYDAKVYQAIFSKIDKAIFLQKENL